MYDFLLLRRKLLISLADHQATSNSWTFLEVNVAIICACLPDVRSLATRVFPCLGLKQSRNVSQYAAGGTFTGHEFDSNNVTSSQASQASQPPKKDDASDEEFILHDMKGVKKTTDVSVSYDG